MTAVKGNVSFYQVNLVSRITNEGGGRSFEGRGGLVLIESERIWRGGGGKGEAVLIGRFYIVGFVSRKRPFRLMPKSSFLTRSKKGFFDATFLDWIRQSKNSVEQVLHLFFEPIASLIPPQNTHPHAHRPIPGTTQKYHTTTTTLPWLSLLLLLAASQRGALLAPLASSVYHTTAAVARVVDAILLNTATSSVALAALG